jgi:ribosomal protein S18 acetylase RimI-like enzyme
MMRPPIAVRVATAADRPDTARLLARAFIDDPAMAYLFPDAAGRAGRLDKFFATIGRSDAVTDGWTLALDAAGKPVAAAIWRPPGAWQTRLWTMLPLLPALLSTFGTGLRRALALQSVLEAHHPQVPHWYLQFAGCDPCAQGQGFGGAAIRARLAQCDTQGLPAALETATPGNLGLYQALGFAITGSHIVPNGPTFWNMWREPR